jgi:uncharacterized protein YjdB
MATLHRVVAALAPLTLLVVACGSGGQWTAPPPPVAAVTVVPESVEVVVRGSVQLGAVTWDASGRAVRGRAVTWASSNPAVGIVSATGLVTALIRGSTTITVTCEGERGTAVVVVFVPMGV